MLIGRLLAGALVARNRAESLQPTAVGSGGAMNVARLPGRRPRTRPAIALQRVGIFEAVEVIEATAQISAWLTGLWSAELGPEPVPVRGLAPPIVSVGVRS
jgi:hypothetical protein